MKVVLQGPDGLFWVNYAKVDPNRYGKWGQLDVALIEDSSTDRCMVGQTYKVGGGEDIGTWVEYPPKPRVMTPPGFTLEELEEAQRMIEGTS